MDPAVLAAASDDDAAHKEEDEDMDDDATEPSRERRLSAYSLRFILSDCTVLETDTGLHFSTIA